MAAHGHPRRQGQPGRRRDAGCLRGGLHRHTAGVRPDFPSCCPAGERRTSTANTIFRDPSWRRRTPPARCGSPRRRCPGLADGDAAHHHQGGQRGWRWSSSPTPSSRPRPSLPNGFGVGDPGDSVSVAPNELTTADRRRARRHALPQARPSPASSAEPQRLTPSPTTVAAVSRTRTDDGRPRRRPSRRRRRPRRSAGSSSTWAAASTRHLRPDQRTPTSNGCRTDVPGRPARSPSAAVRYPAATSVSGSDWRDGIGPREERPVAFERAWRCTEINQFGTDEFLPSASAWDWTPMLAVNTRHRHPGRRPVARRLVNEPAGTAMGDWRATGAPNPTASTTGNGWTDLAARPRTPASTPGARGGGGRCGSPPRSRWWPVACPTRACPATPVVHHRAGTRRRRPDYLEPGTATPATPPAHLGVPGFRPHGRRPDRGGRWPGAEAQRRHGWLSARPRSASTSGTSGTRPPPDPPLRWAVPSVVRWQGAPPDRGGYNLEDAPCRRPVPEQLRPPRRRGAHRQPGPGST